MRFFRNTHLLCGRLMSSQQYILSRILQYFCQFLWLVFRQQPNELAISSDPLNRRRQGVMLRVHISIGRIGSRFYTDGRWTSLIDGGDEDDRQNPICQLSLFFFGSLLACCCSCSGNAALAWLIVVTVVAEHVNLCWNYDHCVVC